MQLPEPLRQQLEALLEHQPEPLRQLISQLPGDLGALLQTPEGLALGALSLALAALCLLVLLRPRGAARTTVVLAGPVNAGKSTAFFQLVDGSAHNGLVASMAENAAGAVVSSARGRAAVRLLDVPGHHSFRHRLEAALRDAAAVVFFVDSAEITPHRVEAAELLYEVLASPGLQGRRAPLLIAANKADREDEAHSVDFVRKTLERQLDALRRTKAVAVGKDAGGARPALGPPDRPFSFAGLRRRVALAECSALAGQLDEVRAFIVASV